MNRNQIIARLRQIRAEWRADGADTQALEQEATELRTQLDQIEARERLFEGLDLDQPGTNPLERRGGDASNTRSPEEVFASPEYRSGWLRSLQGQPLNEAETRAMSTADNSAGPAVPTTTLNLIITKLEQVTALYPRISKSAIPGAMKIPVETAAVAAAWKAENAPITPGDPGLKAVPLGGYELVKLVTVSLAARKMTIDAFESYIVDQVVRKMAIAIEAAIPSGSGSGEPTGFLKGITFADDVNKVTYEEDTAPTYDTIMDALSLLPGPYHAGAVFVCNTKTKYQKLRKIKDNEGRPFFTEGMIDGKPVVVSDQMPDGQIVLGNLAYYHMNMQVEIRVDISDQSGFRNAQIDYRGYAVMDGKPLLDEAFVLIEEETTP